VKPLLLGGADVFHLAHDRAMRALGLGSNQCVFVIEVEGRVDEALLSRRVARALALEPHLSVELQTSMFRRPRWVPSSRAEAHVSVVEAKDPPLRAVETLMAGRDVHDERPWKIVVLRGPERDALLFVWFHPYTDAKGAARFLRWLGEGEGEDLAALPAEGRVRASPEALEAISEKERLALARAYNAHILSFARRPLLSLRGAEAEKPIGAMRFERFLLSRQETAALDKSVRARARLAESSVFLLAGVRVMDRALRRRGFAPVQHLVPVPISLDPKGASERMFGNHLTMMMFALGRDDLADEARAVASLAEQQRAIVRDRLDLGMAAAMELVRVLPSRLYLGLLTLPFGGEMASLIFSNPGVLAIDRFLEIPVVDAYAAPSVVPRPGIELIVNRHAGRLSFVLGAFDGILPAEERKSMMEELRGGVFGEVFRGGVW